MRTLIIIFIILSVAILTVNWASNNIESYTETIDTGFSKTARQNSFIAADIFLNKLGIPTQQIPIFNTIPSKIKPTDTLILLGYRQLLSHKTSQQLIKWVYAGGRLIVTAKPHFADMAHIDHLLIPAGLDVLEYNPSNLAQPLSFKKLFAYFPAMTKALTIDLDFDPTLSLPFDISQHAKWWYGDTQSIHATALSQGKGQLLVLTEFSILANENIAIYDHAQFLRMITQPRSSNERVFYQLPPDIPNIFQWAWTNAKWLMLSCSLLLATILWRLAFRLGPQSNPIETQQNQFSVHLQATGYYHWQRGSITKLLHTMRQNIYHDLHVKHPAILEATIDQQYQRMSQLSKQPFVDVKQAFVDNHLTRTKQLIVTISVLETIRKTL